MRVTKAQAQANRASIVEHASTLFRERGFDGVGVADLMAAAGFTHGGFYKHFQSKSELMEEASACGLAQIAAQIEGADAAQFVRSYISREHRDARGLGCPLSSLGGDAARQPEVLKHVFAEGIEKLLSMVNLPESVYAGRDGHDKRTAMINLLAHAVGAQVLSRACPDDAELADEILNACRAKLLADLEVREDACASEQASAHAG